MSLSEEQILRLLDSNECPEFSLKGRKLPAKIVSVYDGDTCKLNLFLEDGKLYKFNIRIDGYDSPEMKSKNILEKKFAQRSKEYLGNMILGKIVNIECGDFDKYGRILGKIYCKTENGEIFCVNDFMVKNHLGYIYSGKKKQSFDELYKNGYYIEQILDIPKVINYY